MVQTYLKVHGRYQLEAVGIGSCLLSGCLSLIHLLLVLVDGPVVAESVPYAVPDVGLKCPVCYLKLNNCFPYFSSAL